MILRALLTLLGIILCFSPCAAQVAPLSPQDEARAHALFTEIRCPVCVAQSIAESDAGLSGQMRERIRGEISAGKTDAEILSELAARYGDAIRLAPKRERRTAVLWALPWVVLVFGAGMIVWQSKGRRASLEGPQEDEAE